INKEGHLTTAGAANLSNEYELLETLKILENCTSCKNEIGKYYFDKSINKIEKLFIELEEKEEQEEKNISYKLNRKLIKINNKLNWDNRKVILKIMYNSCDKIIDILREVM